jgi:hypothetical protein
LVILLGDCIFFDIDLKLVAVLHQVGKAGLAHAANRVNATGDPYADTVCLEVFAALGRVLCVNARNGIGGVEALAVGLIPERAYFSDALRALLY